MKNVKLDEKHLTVLEKLDKDDMSSTGMLYESTKTTTYPALMRRLSELEEAVLVSHRKGVHYSNTGFGTAVLDMLDRKNVKTAPDV